MPSETDNTAARNHEAALAWHAARTPEAQLKALADYPELKHLYSLAAQLGEQTRLAKEATNAPN